VIFAHQNLLSNWLAYLVPAKSAGSQQFWWVKSLRPNENDFTFWLIFGLSPNLGHSERLIQKVKWPDVLEIMILCLITLYCTHMQYSRHCRQICFRLHLVVSEKMSVNWSPTGWLISCINTLINSIWYYWFLSQCCGCCWKCLGISQVTLPLCFTSFIMIAVTVLMWSC